MPLAIYGRRRLTRLEAALYGGIAAVLIAVVASHLLDLMEAAERLAVESTINQVNGAVTARLAYEVMRGDANVRSWERRNPFDLARLSPRNFVGEVDSMQPGALERGTWAFDPARAELVYFPRRQSGLQTADPDGALRFKAVVNNGIRYVLVPTSPYKWE